MAGVITSVLLIMPISCLSTVAIVHSFNKHLFLLGLGSGAEDLGRADRQAFYVIYTLVEGDRQ